MFLIENVYQDFVLLLVIALNRSVIVRAWFRHRLSQPHTRGDVGLLVDRAIVAHISWRRSCNWRQFVRRQNSNVRHCCARGFCRSRYSTRKMILLTCFLRSSTTLRMGAMYQYCYLLDRWINKERGQEVLSYPGKETWIACYKRDRHLLLQLLSRNSLSHPLLEGILRETVWDN